MGHKEGGNHPQGCQARDLVQPQELGVNHHRPHGRRIQPAGLHLLEGRQILLRRSVAVAVGQDLPPLLHRPLRVPVHLAVGEGGVASVLRAQIGSAHPRGPALWGAVQEHLVPAQAEMLPVIPGVLRQSLK